MRLCVRCGYATMMLTHLISRLGFNCFPSKHNIRPSVYARLHIVDCRRLGWRAGRAHVRLCGQLHCIIADVDQRASRPHMLSKLDSCLTRRQHTLCCRHRRRRRRRHAVVLVEAGAPFACARLHGKLRTSAPAGRAQREREGEREPATTPTSVRTT